jgi:monovalent cation:H+ antiporter, CPA1 family
MPSFELVVAAFLAIALTASIISSRAKAPYTVVLVFFGLIIAATSLSNLLNVNLLYDRLIGGGLFVGLVLPPLLFETTMSIRYEEFRSVARPALRLATFGVIIATIVGGLFLWLIANLPLATSFVFAAIIAPTDTATVLEIFRRSKLPRKLTTLMDTEAVFNDATGITVFTIIVTSLGVAQLSLVSAATEFLKIFAGGIIVGLLVAFIAHLAARIVSDLMSQTMITITTVYGAYTAATALGVSGLVAVAVAGLYYGNTVMKTRVQPQTRRTLRSFWRIMAFIANSIAFLYIGLSTDLARMIVDLVPIGIAFLAVTIARLSSVYPLLGTSRVDGLPVPTAWKNVAMLGGMRGALSIVLAASLPVTVPSRDLVSSMVLGVAFISITIQGYLLSRYLTKKFPRKPKTGSPRAEKEPQGKREDAGTMTPTSEKRDSL